MFRHSDPGGARPGALWAGGRWLGSPCFVATSGKVLPCEALSALNLGSGPRAPVGGDA